MVFEVIHNPAFQQPAGFTQNQFRKLDQLYCSASVHKVLTYRTVECDFDAGLASYTYYLSNQNVPYLQFVIRKVGPATTMFEVYKQGKGRIAKSGVFDRAYEKLSVEIDLLLES
ncbi:MAG: hypothetical protein ACRBDI_04270 [Alphaproteobacteria bacterium]